MRLEFERQLDEYDRQRALPAWDEHVASQQSALERLGFPTFFPTVAPADRSRQQRVVDVLNSVLED
jgi:hypothetical protein